MAYKVFDKGLVNRYGVKFKEHSTYILDTSERGLKFGNNGYGFHYVERLEDGLRYFDGLNNEIDIALVYPLGDTVEGYDEFYEYFNMFVTDKLYIDHVLSREEILDYTLHISELSAARLIKGYRLTKDEQDIIKEHFHNDYINKTIDYYQNNNIHAYDKVKKKVKK